MHTALIIWLAIGAVLAIAAWGTQIYLNKDSGPEGSAPAGMKRTAAACLSLVVLWPVVVVILLLTSLLWGRELIGLLTNRRKNTHGPDSDSGHHRLHPHQHPAGSMSTAQRRKLFRLWDHYCRLLIELEPAVVQSTTDPHVIAALAEAKSLRTAHMPDDQNAIYAFSLAVRTLEKQYQRAREREVYDEIYRPGRNA